jgi:hypothetical protein
MCTILPRTRIHKQTQTIRRNTNVQPRPHIQRLESHLSTVLQPPLSLLSIVVQQSIAIFQPPTNTLPLFPTRTFLNYLDKAGITYLNPYTDQLDSNADYSAAATPRPDQ